MAFAPVVPTDVLALAAEPEIEDSALAARLGLDVGQILHMDQTGNPFGVSPAARVAMQDALGNLACHQDDAGVALKADLSKRFNVGVAQILLGNGAGDVLRMIAACFLGKGDSVVWSRYAHSLCKQAVLATGATGIEARPDGYGHDLLALRAAIQPSTRMVFIVNPNNPTGTAVRPGDLLEFLEECPREVLVVLDEAYADFLPPEKRPDSSSLLRQFPNLIVCRTFSTSFGLARLPLGYALGSTEVIALASRLQRSGGVNALAQVAALATASDLPFLRTTVANNRAGLAQISEAMLRSGLSYISGYGNFLTFHCGDGEMLYQFLLGQGIIVRSLVDYGMRDSLRVSVGLPAQNARFIDALQLAMDQ